MTTTIETLIASHHGEDHAPDLDSALRRAPRISQEDVFRTADELLVEGHRPTIDRVRMKLGRGSPNTINDHLDAWWAKLGSRLRDLPDRQFPQLPERVAATLQQLWNEALEGAHEALQSSLTAHQAVLAERERTVDVRLAQLADAERAAAGRTAALDENLALARAQLTEANQRAASLAEALRERDGAVARVRSRLDKLEADHAALARKLESEREAHLLERARLEERHAATEARWLTEVDRTRQMLKEAERQAKDVQAQLAQRRADGERTRKELASLAAELSTARAVRTQLEERIRLLTAAARASADAPAGRVKGARPTRTRRAPR